jgi:hypothetical protein
MDRPDIYVAPDRNYPEDWGSRTLMPTLTRAARWPSSAARGPRSGLAASPGLSMDGDCRRRTFESHGRFATGSRPKLDQRAAACRLIGSEPVGESGRPERNGARYGRTAAPS